MDDDNCFSIFRPIPKEVIQQLKKQQIECECQFTKQPNMQDQDQFVTAQKGYLLQIIDQYIVQLNPSSKKIIGGLRLSLDIKFQVISIELAYNFDIERPFAISLYLPDDDDEDQQFLAIRLGVQIEKWKEIQKFCKCLQSKEIVFYGYHKSFTIERRIYASYSTCIYEAMRKGDDKRIALKSINKQNFSQQTKRPIKKAMQRQFLIPFNLNHKNICKMFQICDSQTCMALIMEKLDISLLNFLKIREFKSALQLKNTIKQIFEGVAFLHKKGIMHRDLKPENIMMRQIQKDKFEPVIIDFGLAQYEGCKPYLFQRCGTPGYAAPQLIAENFSQENIKKSCDIFSLGCVLYFCLIKKPLIFEDSLYGLITANRNFKLEQNDEKYSIIHETPRNLLFGMLSQNPQKRITIQEALQHPFFTEQFKSQSEGSNQFSKTETVN